MRSLGSGSVVIHAFFAQRLSETPSLRSSSLVDAFFAERLSDKRLLCAGAP